MGCDGAMTPPADSNNAPSPASDRVRVRRIADRGDYDPAVIREILAAAPFAHMGAQSAHGPIVLPMAIGLGAEDLYLHGAAANAILKDGEGAEICVTVTHFDGLVLARSVMHHSMNYRCVVVRGKARVVDDPDEKWEALRLVTDHIVPGRWDDARQPNRIELLSTQVLAVPLSEASAKIRAAGVIDEDEDLGLDVWAGVVPAATVWGAPEPDKLMTQPPPPPAYLPGNHA